MSVSETEFDADSGSEEMIGSASDGGVLGMIFGFAVMPFFAVLAPRMLAELMTGTVLGTVWTPEARDYFDANRRDPAADPDRVKDMIAGLQALVEEDAWEEVSAQIAEWEAARAYPATSDARWSDLALDLIRHSLSDKVYAPNMCNFENYYEIPDAALARVEAAARANPSDPILTALLAQVHIDRGWCARGGGWSSEVDEEGWQGLARSFETAHNLLARFDLREVRSPTLSRVSFQLLAAAEASITEVREAYLAWSDLDVANPLPHRAVAFYVMPRWFGSWPMLEQEAQSAVTRTAPLIGPEAYAHFYLQALEYEEDALIHLDMALFEKALDTMIARHPTPALSALEIACDLHETAQVGFSMIWDEVLRYRLYRKKAELKHLVRRLLGRWITHLPTREGSALERKALGTIGAVFQRDLRRGKSVAFTQEGLRMVDAPPDEGQVPGQS